MGVWPVGTWPVELRRYEMGGGCDGVGASSSTSSGGLRRRCALVASGAVSGRPAGVEIVRLCSRGTGLTKRSSVGGFTIPAGGWRSKSDQWQIRNGYSWSGTGNLKGSGDRVRATARGSLAEPRSRRECLKFRFYVWPAQANHGMFETAILNRVWRFGLELNKACVLQRRFACTLHGNGVLF